MDPFENGFAVPYSIYPTRTRPILQDCGSQALEADFKVFIFKERQKVHTLCGSPN